MDPLPWFESVKPEWRTSQYLHALSKGKGGVPEPAQPPGVPAQPPGLPPKAKAMPAEPATPPQKPAVKPAKFPPAAEGKPKATTGPAPEIMQARPKAHPPQLRQATQYVESMHQFDPQGELSDFLVKVNSGMETESKNNLKQAQIQISGWLSKLKKVKESQNQLAEKLSKDLADVTAEIEVYSQLQYELELSDERINLRLQEVAVVDKAQEAQDAIAKLRELGLSKEQVLEMMGGSELGSALHGYLASASQGSSQPPEPAPFLVPEPEHSQPEHSEDEGSESKKAKTEPFQ